MIDRLAQLSQQFVSATICRAALEAAAFSAPDHETVCALLEARDAEDACRAELQKELWLATTEQAA